MKKTIEELLQSPFWIIDILPLQVPTDSPGQYFTIEKYFLQDKQFAEIKQKHINLILKLNCYRDISIDEERVVNPSPECIADEMRKRYLYILTGGRLILQDYTAPGPILWLMNHTEMPLANLIGHGDVGAYSLDEVRGFCRKSGLHVEKLVRGKKFRLHLVARKKKEREEV